MAFKLHTHTHSLGSKAPQSKEAAASLASSSSYCIRDFCFTVGFPEYLTTFHYYNIYYCTTATITLEGNVCKLKENRKRNKILHICPTPCCCHFLLCLLPLLQNHTFTHILYFISLFGVCFFFFFSNQEDYFYFNISNQQIVIVPHHLGQSLSSVHPIRYQLLLLLHQFHV